jgi:hypothetical protein
LQQRSRGERGGDQARPPLPLRERPSRADRDHLHEELVPRPDAGSARGHRAAQVPAGIRPAPGRVPFRRLRRRGRARARRLREDLRRPGGADPGRGWRHTGAGRVSTEGAGAVHEDGRAALARRGADRDGADRQVFRVRAFRAGAPTPTPLPRA